MKTIAILLILVLFSPVSILNAQESKKVFHQAMEQEIARNMKSLHLEGMKDPFFIGMNIVDINMSVVYSALGSLIRQAETPNRFALNNLVLVGDYNTNNLNFTDPRAITYPMRTFGILPLDNSAQEIQNKLWIILDRAYKLSAEIYESKQSALKSKTQETGVTGIPDFMEGAGVQVDKPEILLKMDNSKMVNY